MTYTTRIRSAGGYLRCEFECPEHGRFESLVIRVDDGNPPDSTSCDKCGSDSIQVTSAVMGRIKRGEVQRGKSDERPPGFLNTEPLADGMPPQEWSAQVDKETFDMRRKVVREKMGI